LVYTGGHDGSLIAWNLETGYSKYTLHIYDKTCQSENYIRESKSVDKLLILEKRKKLLSMTADQNLRFWDLSDAKPPTFKFHCRHPDDDHLTAVAVTKDNNYLLTGDTSGQMKMWDISEVDLDDPST
jgi:WD40 repeat protein